MQKIIELNKKSKKLLQQCMLDTISHYEYLELIRQVVLMKLQLPLNVEEINIYKLCVLSIKLQAGKMTEDIVNRINKFDCHNIDAAVKKKVLLIMWLERQLNKQIDNDLIEMIETTIELAEALREAE